MWLTFLVALAFLSPARGRQQAAPAPRWHVTIGEGLRFSRGATDTSEVPDVRASLRPTARLGVHLGLSRSLGAWEADIGAEYAGGQVEAYNAALKIVDRTAPITRYRIGDAVGRRLIGAGAGYFAVLLGPTVDMWAVDGEHRVRVGGEVRVALRLPLGKVELENRITVGLSASPIEADDVGAGGVKRPRGRSPSVQDCGSRLRFA
jgi:hypothetical protein